MKKFALNMFRTVLFVAIGSIFAWAAWSMLVLSIDRADLQFHYVSVFLGILTGRFAYKIMTYKFED